MKLLSHGYLVQAIVFAFGLDERTVMDWLVKSGQHCQQVHEQLIEQPRPLGQVQADELRIRVHGGVVWLARALMVSTRLWLGGAVSEQRVRRLIERLISRVKLCAAALGGALLFCTDGLASIRQLF